MKLPPYCCGLGWQPDLPDLRDKTLSVAVAKMNSRNGNASGSNGHPPESRKTSRLRRPFADGPQTASRHTYHGWQLSAGQLEAQLLGNGRVLPRRFSAAMATSFGKASANRTLLLDKPPSKPLAFVDLSPFMSPVEQQENLGSCTAHAVISLVEYLQIATRGEYVDGSRMFLYKATRDLLQWVGDTGAYIRETIKAVRLFGICPETYWVYDTSRFDEEPTTFCYAFAANYKALRYYRLENLIQIKQSISQGYPVAFGFTCFESMFTRQTQATGQIPYPGTREKVVGGHAVLAVGYNDTDDGGTAERPCPPGHVLIRNSWGPDWGHGGYGFLPYEFFDPGVERIDGYSRQRIPLADDFWTMTHMSIPELDQVSAAPFLMQDETALQPSSGRAFVRSTRSIA